MGLTAVAIKAAKGRDKQYKLADSGGMHLLVLPSGQRYWRMNYRHLGKYKTLAFGVWPDVDLASARAQRDETRELLASGRDPSEQAKLDKIAASVAAANTFRAVAEEWYAKAEKEGLAPATLNKIRWLLDFAYPSFGNRPIAEITKPAEVGSLLRVIEGYEGHPITLAALKLPLPPQSDQLEAIKVHNLGPRRHKVTDERLLCIG